MKSWSDLGFRIEVTGDGSPSLRLLKSLREDRPDGEAMHHSGGAAAETDLIYGSCIREVFSAVSKPAFIVVGLGLGYIEMLIAKESLLKGLPIQGIHSFESLEGLRQFFYQWVHDTELPWEISQTYDQAAGFILGESLVTKNQLKDFLKLQFPDLSSISGALETTTEFKLPANGILYDAFSSKTSPDLWEEEFLRQFLIKAAGSPSFISTYACKGSLKRALKEQKFEVIQKPGFQGKRNSLFARRT